MFFCLCYMLKVEHCESPQSHRLDFCGWLSQLQCEPHKPVAKWCMPHTESQTKYRYKVVEITKFLKVIGIKKKRIHDRRLSRQGEKELLCSQYLFSEVVENSGSTCQMPQAISNISNTNNFCPTFRLLQFVCPHWHKTMLLIYHISLYVKLLAAQYT